MWCEAKAFGRFIGRMVLAFFRDWRLALTIMVFTLTFVLGYVAVSSTREVASRGRKIDHLVAKLDESQRKSDAFREKSTAERKVMLKNQERVLKLLKEAQAQR